MEETGSRNNELANKTNFDNKKTVNRLDFLKKNRQRNICFFNLPRSNIQYIFKDSKGYNGQSRFA